MNEPQATPLTHTPPTIPLTAHILRFTGRVTEPIHLPTFSGSSLRGAFASHLRRAFCPEWRAEKTDPAHRARCPACYMLTLDGAALDAVEEERHGDIRRPYALRPPLDAPRTYQPGDRLHFHMVLFGRTLAFLPYLLLTVQGMGEEAGLGLRDPHTRRRGRFQLESVQAENPFTDQAQTVLAPGERTVQLPTIPVTDAQIRQAAYALIARLGGQGNRLALRFRTPLRLQQRRQLLDRPEPFPLIKHVVRRVLDLAAQHGEGRPDVVLRRDVYPFADQVTLLEDQTRWWDVEGYSSRLGRRQKLGGLVGRAVYTAPAWEPLLPWLLWGSVTQVGKNIVKGAGLYELECETASETEEPWPSSNT